MPKETRRATGRIELLYDWWESGSSHNETTHTVTLSAEDGILILTDATISSKVFKRSDTSVKKWQIAAEALIQLIKEHGTELFSR